MLMTRVCHSICNMPSRRFLGKAGMKTREYDYFHPHEISAVSGLSGTRQSQFAERGMAKSKGLTPNFLTADKQLAVC